MLSVFYFVAGEKEKQLEIADKAIELYRKIILNMVDGSIPGSSHFADLASANNAIEVMLSGVEWVESKDTERIRWSPSSIIHAS